MTDINEIKQNIGRLDRIKKKMANPRDGDTHVRRDRTWLISEVDRLLEVVSALPRCWTMVDGELEQTRPVVPGMVLWPQAEFFVPDEQGGRVELCIVDIETGERIAPYDGVAGWQPDKCCDSREAAEAVAKMNKKGA